MVYVQVQVQVELISVAEQVMLPKVHERDEIGLAPN